VRLADVALNTPYSARQRKGMNVERVPGLRIRAAGGRTRRRTFLCSERNAAPHNFTILTSTFPPSILINATLG
jgi:hypothetical protein